MQALGPHVMQSFKNPSLAIVLVQIVIQQYWPYALYINSKIVTKKNNG